MNAINCVVVFVAMLAALLCIQIAAQSSGSKGHSRTTTSTASPFDENNVRKPENSKLYSISSNLTIMISEQISCELGASMQYLAMAAFFGQDNVALMGFKKFFMENSDEEKEHAKKFVDYLNERNGRLTEIQINMPIDYIGGTGNSVSGLEALKEALKLENKVSNKLMLLHSAAVAQGDVHLVDALESDYLREQVESTRHLQGMITRLDRISIGNNAKLGEYLFDQELREKS